MPVPPNCATFVRSDERMADMVTPDGHGYAEPMFGELSLEPWMDGVLDESLLMDAPGTWQNFSSFDSIPTHVDAALAHATPNLFDSMLADCSQLQDTTSGGQESFSNNLNFSSDALDTSANLADFLSEEATYPITQLDSSFEATLSASSATQGRSFESDDEDDHCQVVFEQVASAFKDLARARAAADPRPISRKQKQRDASIALYLERLRDTCNEAVAALNSNATTYASGTSARAKPNPAPSGRSSFSAGNGPSSSSSPSEAFTDLYSQPQSTRSSVCPAMAPSRSQTGSQRSLPPTPPSGGVELVMDLNMNAATTLPRRHRPRTETQRQRYLAVRNQGACEKHKKQHKRCTCVDKMISASSLSQNSASGSAGSGLRAHATGVGVGGRVAKATLAGCWTSSSGSRASLSPSSGEDTWPALQHNIGVHVRNDRVDPPGNDSGTACNELGRRTMLSTNRRPPGRDALVDPTNSSVFSAGNSRGAGRSSYAQSHSIQNFSATEANPSVMGCSACHSRANDLGSTRSRQQASSIADRNIRDRSGRKSHDGLRANSGTDALKKSSLLVFPDGNSSDTANACCRHSRPVNKDKAGQPQRTLTSHHGAMNEAPSWLQVRYCCCCPDGQLSTLEGKTQLLKALLYECSGAAINRSVRPQQRQLYLKALPQCTPERAFPSGSALSPGYPGLRYFIRIINEGLSFVTRNINIKVTCLVRRNYNGNKSLSHKKSSSHEREFALWCFIWLSVLLLSTCISMFINPTCNMSISPTY